MNKKTIGLGFFSITLGIAILIMSNGIRDFAAVGVGAKFFPRIAAVGFMILGALLVYQNRSAIFVRAVNQDAKKAISFAPFVTLGLLILYLALIPLLGYIVASTLYIFCQIIVLNRGNKQRYVQYALISIVCSAIIYLLFVKVFTVMIPSGILG
jgi:putative tricarboxylic transport membrane protein